MIFVSSTAFKEDIFESEGRALSEKFSNIELSGGNGYYPDSILVEKLDKLFQKKIKKFLIHNYFPIPHTSFVLNFASSDKTVIDNPYRFRRGR